MLRRLPPLLAPALVVLLGGAGPFEGCDESSEDAPRALPRDTSGACFFDEDCVPTGCEALRCIAGACTEVAPIRDSDGDGEAPPPCGTDCDDRNVSIAPGATELCDLVDQDCDGAVDEDAVPRAIRFDVTTNDATMAVTSWGDRLVLSDATFFASGGARARRLALDGSLGTIEPLLSESRAVRAVDADASASGAWFAIALEPSAAASQPTIALVRVDRDATTGAVVPVGDAVRRDVNSAAAVAIAVVDETPFVAWDAFDGTRRVWSPAWPDAVQVGEGLVTGLGALDLATDGTHVVVPSGVRDLAFLATSDGATVATVPASGDLSPGRPLASDEGRVWALVRDAFDHSVQTIASTGASPLTTLPTGESVQLGIDRTSDGLVLTRAGFGGVRAWVLDAVFPSTIRRTFSPEEISGSASSISGIDVASTTQGTAIVTNFGAAGSSLAVLACGREE